MRYYLDTEFSECPGRIELISLGLVAQDGREFYAEAIFDPGVCNTWVVQHVFPKLQTPPAERLSAVHLAQKVRLFIGADVPEFWGYYADYDWVVFCWLFGAMIDLPDGWPKYCRDLKQSLDDFANSRYGSVSMARVPFEPENEHHALSDARWIKLAHEWLRRFSSAQG